jgi:DNA-binding SARP family transcriptional activator/Flp pilus assembly protein TadD
MRVESSASVTPSARVCPIQVRLLGALEVCRAGSAAALPASRKVRALFAYLVLAPRAIARSQLCDLLWDLPDDPRAELRWCLTKIRRFFDDRDRPRVRTDEDFVQLDCSDCSVDARAVARALERGVDALPVAEVRSLAALFDGDLVEGLDVERSPAFATWLAAERRRFRNAHVALLARLAQELRDDDALAYLERWIQLAPFEPRAHARLLGVLAGSGRMQDAEEHLTVAMKRFVAEGLDPTPLHLAWRSTRDALSRPESGRAPVALVVDAQAGADVLATPARRASVAVMPFVDAWAAPAAPAAHAGIGDALAHDVITRLAKLRSLFVIAPGSVFALKERRLGSEEAGRMLDVDYVVTGATRIDGSRLTVTAELAETGSGRVAWAEIFTSALDDALGVLEAIGNRIVASVASEIEAIERSRAVLRPPNGLDAWQAHHRGLWHMYRFTKADNEQAQRFFRLALQLDPTYSRPYAGLSFTHWQNAFQGWAEREPEAARALQAAECALRADDRDPGAHWAMGRALWLQARDGESVSELERAVDLSPNFALGHYTLAFVQSQTGDPDAAVRAADLARTLSPFDPLLFGMLGAKAMSLVRQGRFDEAASVAVKAAGCANAHKHIQAIAAFCLTLAGAAKQAQSYAEALRRTDPGYRLAHFLAAFRFDPAGERLFREAARKIGMT